MRTIRTDAMMLGTARADITPPLGTVLSGWPGLRAATEIHRPLEARALWLSDGDRSVVLLTLDLLGLASTTCSHLRENVARHLEVPASAVMISCSHTHSGPVVPPWRGDGVPAPDDAYVGWLVERVETCAVDSSSAPVPVRVGHAARSCDLGVNRRARWDDGRVGYPPHADPDGAVDREVGIIRFDDEATNVPVAVVMSYGCHPTVGGPSTWIGPDYPGAAREVVEDELPGATALFVLGNCGDVRPNLIQPDGSFRWDASRRDVDAAGRRLGRVGADVARGIVTRRSPTVRFASAVWPVFSGDGSLIEDAEFLAFRIGDAVLVSSPAECFAAIGTEIRVHVREPLLFASVTNGFFGYVATREEYAYGGYEVDLSWPAFGLPARVREDAHDAFTDGMLAAIGGVT